MPALRRCLVVVLLLGAARFSVAQPFDVSWWTADGGGAMGLTGGPYAVSGTIGQPDAGGPFAGGPFVVEGGFWAGIGGTSPAGAANLEIVLTDLPDPVVQGETLTYSVRVANNGPSASTGMSVVTVLPPGVAFLSSTPALPTCTPGSTVACTLGSLAPGLFHTVTIRVGVPPGMAGSISATASVTGNEPDPNTANNVFSEATWVLPRARGELSHGTSLLGNLTSVAGGPDVDLFRIVQWPASSYEVIVDAASGDVGNGTGPLLHRVGPDGSSLVQASQPAGAGPARTLRWETTSATAVVDQFVRVASAACGSDCGPDDVYRLRAYDTTYSIPRFNNAGTQITVVLVQNTGAQAVSGRLYFRRPNGFLLHTEPLALAPRALFSFNSSGVAALAGESGTMTLTSDAPYGTLAGKAVALEPATGYSFDSPMTPRPR